MGIWTKNAWQGCTAALLTVMAGIALGAPAASGNDAVQCATMRAALQAMLDTEYAFGEKAQSSVRDAFLEYLAEDSLVLNPGPERGRSVYESAPGSKDKLDWYPSLADVAPSGDLGFTTGPWVYTGAAGGEQLHGHFLTIWKRDSQCKWHVAFDGGISHAVSTSIEPKLPADQATFARTDLPQAALVAHDAPGHAVSDFQDTARRDGLAAALRTYGRNNDFQFYTNAQAPIGGVGPASAYLNAHPIDGAWKEDARGQSLDSTMTYCVGELSDGNKHSTHAYAEIWQYDPKVANWGLRVLLVVPLPPAKANPEPKS
jgi:hypothetical protein